MEESSSSICSGDNEEYALGIFYSVRDVSHQPLLPAQARGGGSVPSPFLLLPKPQSQGQSQIL